MTITLEEALAAPDRIAAADATALNGFGGLHGGVAAALLARGMRADVPADRRLVALAVRYLARVAEPMSVEVPMVRAGARTTAVFATGTAGGAPVIRADGVFGAEAAPLERELAPEMPRAITPWREATPFEVPPEFVPISTRMEIRPAAGPLPYSGAAEPSLTAWVRLTDPVADPTERVLVLADALAPSYAAVLRDPTPVPTVSMSVHLSPRLADTPFDWVLIRAVTTAASQDRWASEVIDVWSESGVHLATAGQLRLVQ